MYVVCQRCAAAYVVEDRLVAGKDARAQCPICLHVQTVGSNARAPELPTSPAMRRAAVHGPTASAEAFRVPSIAPVGPLAPSELSVDEPPPGAGAKGRADAAICRDCGAALTDAFDRALGVCERCRIGVQGDAAAASAEATEPEGYPPGAELEENLEAPLEERPRRRSLLRIAATHAPTQWRAGRVFGAIVVVAALGAGGVALLAQRREPKRVKKEEPVRLAGQLEKARQRWGREFPGLKGDAFQFLKQGGVELARDTPSGYEEAEKSFQKAFLLQAGGEAVAGYLQATAWGRGPALDDATIDELINLAEGAEIQWGRSPRILIAYASLLLTRRESPRSSERARSFAEEAVGSASGRDKALAHLVLSSAFLASSAELAIQNTELALKLDPGLRRGYLQRAIARQSLGDYRSAISDLEKRLSLDPDQSEARAALSRIYQEVGEPALAYKLFPPSSADLSSVVARAVIQYQVEQKPQAAARALREGIQAHGADAPPQLGEAWGHLAAAERLTGRLESAVNAAGEALRITSADPAPHLQLFLVELSRGRMEEAGRHLSALKRRLQEPGLEKLLEGRLLFAQHRDAEAMRSFADAAQLDRRRLDALLLAGAAAASAGKRDETLRYLVLAGQMDPTRAAPRQVATRFYLRPEENLVGAEGRVVRLAKGSTDVTPRLYEALIRFHQRDWSAADKLLQQVVDIDVTNALAHALRALIALQKGSLRAARTSAARAVAGGRGLALAHYAQGSVLVRSGKVDAARTEFQQAEALAPTLLAAQVSLAELDARKKSPDAARARLVHVLRVDPSYLAAKRALYALER